MVNDVGFENQLNNAGELATAKKKVKTANEIHLKYVDDLTVAEAVRMKENLSCIPLDSRPLPDAYNSRTGHFLPLASVPFLAVWGPWAQVNVGGP